MLDAMRVDMVASRSGGFFLTGSTVVLSSEELCWTRFCFRHTMFASWGTYVEAERLLAAVLRLIQHASSLTNIIIIGNWIARASQAECECLDQRVEHQPS